MLFTEKWLSRFFKNNKIISSGRTIDKVFIDSREKVSNGLFIPIVGERFDGHDFVLQAIKNGAVAVFWEQTKALPKDFPKDVTVFFVEDTTKALQYLSHEYKRDVNPRVIGITGSNGKTTTKDLVAAVVSSSYKTHFTDGNFNNHIGLPLTILSMAKETEVLVLEMGMNAFGEIDLLSKIAQPDISIITNIGESHIEFLGSRAGITKAKLEIRNGMPKEGILIIDGDEEYLSRLSEEENVITCGFNLTNDVKINNIENNLEMTRFTLDGNRKFEIPLIGDHHAKNASYAITVGKLLNINDEEIKKSLQKLKLSGMRFEFLKGKNGVTIVNDAYNASPTSMIGAINTIRSLANFNNKILVLGDIFELGSYGVEFHKQIGKHVKEPITALFTYGDLAKEISSIAKKEEKIIVEHTETEEELLTKLKPYLNQESIILFKASRGMEFEQFITQLTDET